MGRGSVPREQLKAFPALVPIQTLEKTPCLPCSWSLTGTPGTVLDVRAGKLSGDNDHSHSEHPAKEQHPQKPRHLVTPQPSRRHVLGGTVLREREKQTKGSDSVYSLIYSTVASLGACGPSSRSDPPGHTEHVGRGVGARRSMECYIDARGSPPWRESCLQADLITYFIDFPQSREESL